MSEVLKNFVKYLKRKIWIARIGLAALAVSMIMYSCTIVEIGGFPLATFIGWTGSLVGWVCILPIILSFISGTKEVIRGAEEMYGKEQEDEETQIQDR